MTIDAPRRQKRITVVDAQPPIYTQDDFDRAVAGIRERNEFGWRCRADARHSSILETRKHISKSTVTVLQHQHQRTKN